MTLNDGRLVQLFGYETKKKKKGENKRMVNRIVQNF